MDKWIQVRRKLSIELINYINNNRDKDKKYIEDNKLNNDKYRLIRKFHPRCLDSMIWKYDGIVKYLNFMNKMERFSCLQIIYSYIF